MSGIDQNLNQPMQQDLGVRKPIISKTVLILIIVAVVAVLGSSFFIIWRENSRNGQPADISSDQANGGSLFYMKTASPTMGPEEEGILMVSDLSGLHKTKIQTGLIQNNKEYVVSGNGKLIYADKDLLGYGVGNIKIWLRDKGSQTANILTIKDALSVDSIIVSLDNQKIAYSVETSPNGIWDNQVWTANIDGSDNKLLSGYFSETGRPVLLYAWPDEPNLIYAYSAGMFGIEDTEDEDESVEPGFYTVNTQTAEIKRLDYNYPNGFFESSGAGWNLSNDRKKILFTPSLFSGSADQIIIFDLIKGTESVVLNNQDEDTFISPIWSEDDKKIVYANYKPIGEGNYDLMVYDMNLKTSRLILSSKNLLYPVAWLDNNQIAYIEEANRFSSSTSYLNVINLDGTDKREIDSAGEIIFLGTFNQ